MRLLVLSLLLPIFIFHKTNNELTGYIMISYTGDVSKPYPIVIFDHLGKFDTTYFDTSIYNLFFIHIYQIEERELLDLKQTIQEREIIFNSDTLLDELAIRIVIDEQDNIIFIKGREEISRLFKRIIDQWRESDKAILKSRLGQLSKGIGVPIITD